MTGENSDGKIGIENGNIKVTDPEGSGGPAVLYPPGEGAVIFVNGEPVRGPVRVGTGDRVEVEVSTTKEEPGVEVKISPDELYAYLAVHPAYITSYILKDAEMRAQLEPSLQRVVEEEKAVDVAQVEEILESKNITFGLDYAAIKEAVDKADGEFKLIAKGEEMEEGRDGWVEYLVSTEVEFISYNDEEERVDYRERYRFPTVKKGEVIAVVHPPAEGRPGKTVTGKVLIPKSVKAAKVRCGEGVDFKDNNRELVALKEGRLIVRGNHVKVVNLYVHNGNVDLESGNIRFSGDVRIYGNVMEGMTVDSQGDLLIEGSGYGAVIRAGGEIKTAKNLIKCSVEGGLIYSTLKVMISLVEELKEEYLNFLNNFKQVVKGLSQKGETVDEKYISRIISVLMQKNNELQENIKKLVEQYEGFKESASETLGEIVSLLATLKEDPSYFGNVTELSRLEKLLNAYAKETEETFENVPSLEAAYIQNSTVKHSGDINITGAGSYFSSLYAEGKVSVSGVFRGGIIEAGGDVFVNEFVFISTSAESSSKRSVNIKVPANTFIYFNKVTEDSAVQVGKLIYRFDSNYSRVRVGYDKEEGMLKLTSF